MKKKLLLLCLVLPIITIQTYAITENTKKHNVKCECEEHHHIEKLNAIQENSTLTIRDCISIGIENSPIIKKYADRLEIAKSLVGIAKSDYFPGFGVGVGFRQEFNSNREDFYNNYRELPTVGVALKQLIWNFGKTTSDIKMKEFLQIAAEYELKDAICGTVFNIKTHYYNLLRAKSIFEATQTNLNLQNNIILEMEKLVKEGKKNKVDLLTAKVEKKVIENELIKAEDEYLNSIEALNNAIYLENAPKYEIYETQTYSYRPKDQNSYKNVSDFKHGEISKDDTIFDHPKYSYDEAVEIAYNNSPDMHALSATKDAMEQALIRIKRNYYPELTAGVGYGLLNSNQVNNNSFNVEVGLDASVNAMRQKYDVKGAKAELDLAKTEIVAFKKNLYFTVRKCLNTVKSTYNAIPISKQGMELAADNFDSTLKNYKQNIMDQSELESARTYYYASLLEYIDSQYDYNIALIKLEMSMHEHLIDYHDDTEHAINFHKGNEIETITKLINCNKKHKPKK